VALHQLFADLLRARLAQEQPERVPGLHHAAAGWCERHGLADEAVRHALAAGDPTWAARLIERHADELLLRSEGATVQPWLAALPAELVEARPRLLLAEARVALLGGRVEEGQARLDAAERAMAAAPGGDDAPYEPSVGRAASLLVNVPATIALDRAWLAELRGDADLAIASASRALAEVGDGEWMLESNANGYLGIAEWLGGRLPEAERLLSSTVARWRAAGERYLAVRGCHHLGQVQRARGDLDAALQTYRQALELAAPPGRPVLPAAGVAQVGIAEVAYQRGELDTALEQVTEGIERCRQVAYVQPLATGLATLAWIRQAGGDQAGALAALAGTLVLARPQGYLRVFADEGAPMRALLGRLVTTQRTE
jgi:LuxR family maltose regulon positive regulatory protein